MGMLRARELIAAIALTAIFAGSARSEPAAATQPALAFTAQTVAPAKRQGAVNVAGGAWRCQGTTCSRMGPQTLLSVDACKALAHEVGAIRSYGYPAKRLDAGELSKCNEGLAAAAPAPAQPALFTAHTVAPARRQGAVNVPGGVWRCQASTCTRTGPETLLSVDVCKDLARQVGALNAYSRPGKSLTADELGKCNEGLAAAAPPPAQPLQFTAETAARARRQGAVNVPGGTWRCAASTCTRSGPESLLSVDNCKALTKEVGAVRVYGYPAKKLAPDDLGKCNEGLVASAPPPAPPPPAPPPGGPGADPSAPFTPITVRAATIRYTGGTPATFAFTPLRVTTGVVRYQGGGTAAATPPFTPLVQRTDTITYVGRPAP
jgi:hypothetical protein